jgi:primase-polymerase (primpol)-like protein
MFLPHEERWVCWRWEQRGNKVTKPPIQCGVGYPAYARTNDPTTWGVGDTALARVTAGEADGVGYCLPDAYLGAIDLDNCYDWDNEIIAPWAQEIINRAPKGTYVEITVSGTGLRLIGIAEGPPLDANAEIPNSNGGRIELYRNKARYITVSGNSI